MVNTEGVKNIIFDLGGVILNLDYNLTIRAFEKLGVSNFDEIFSQFKQSDLTDRFEKGIISEGEFHQSLVEILGIDFSLLQYREAWNAMLLDLPQSRIHLLKELSPKYRLFLFSNTNETHYNSFILKEESDFEEVFEKAYYSHHFGKRKPDADSFQSILEENNLIAEETLFIDDSIQHIESAQRLGMRTLYLSETDIIHEFT